MNLKAVPLVVIDDRENKSGETFTTLLTSDALLSSQVSQALRKTRVSFVSLMLVQCGDMKTAHLAADNDCSCSLTVRTADKLTADRSTVHYNSLIESSTALVNC
jgi:hypothetical protein